MYIFTAFFGGILFGLSIGVLVCRVARRREADGDLFIVSFGNEHPTMLLSPDKDVSEIKKKDSVTFNVRTKIVPPKGE